MKERRRNKIRTLETTLGYYRKQNEELEKSKDRQAGFFMIFVLVLCVTISIIKTKKDN